MMRTLTFLVFGIVIGILAARLWSQVGHQTNLDNCVAPDTHEYDQCIAGRLSDRIRWERHVREAQADYRRCLASHSSNPDVAAAVRRGVVPVIQTNVDHRRAAILPLIPAQAAVVPSPSEPVDVVMVWANCSDVAWQFAANAAGQSTHAADCCCPDNGELLHALRSLIKYGRLRVRSIVLLVSGGQQPHWLLNSLPERLPPIRIVGDFELGMPPVFSLNALWRRLPLVPGLGEVVLAWPKAAFLGAPLHHQDLWRTAGGWGPRIRFQPPFSAKLTSDNALLNRLLHTSSVSRTLLAHVPLPISRTMLELLLERVGSDSLDDLLHVYAHWLAANGLTGGAEVTEELFTVTGAMSLPDALQGLHQHVFVALDSGGRQRRVLQKIMEEQWPFPTAYEKYPSSHGEL